jgi:hypothetical protein
MRDGSILLGALMPADLFTQRVYGEQGLKRTLGDLMPADLFTQRVYGEQGLKRTLGHFDLIDKYLPESMQARGVAGLGQTPVPAPREGATLTNPYPNGVSVAGTGPNNTATSWRVGYHPEVGLWVADSGFGVAPLYRTAAEMGQLTSRAHLIPYYRHPTLSIYGFPAFGARVLEGFVARNPPPNLYPGMDLVILTSDGGQQYIWYRYDGLTGYWVPAHAQGTGAPGSNIFGELLIAGAVLAAVVVTYGAATGWFAGAGSLLTAGNVGFVGSAASAAGAVAKLVGGGGGSPAPIAVVPAPAVAALPQQTIAPAPAATPTGTPATPGTYPPGSLPPVGSTVALPTGGVGTVVALPGGGTGIQVSTPGAASGSPTDAAAADSGVVPMTAAMPSAAGLQQLISQVPSWAWGLAAGGALFALLRK